MNILKNVKGITLVALVVSIIVLLILVGITFITLNDLIIDKAVMASSKTTESFIKEQVEMAWISCEVSWIEDNQKNQNITKDTYFKEKLKENLKNIKEFSDIKISGDIEDNITICFNYKTKTNAVVVTSDGKVNLYYLLKGNVRVGDYVEYPIEYTDVYSEEHYIAKTGWRVIDDGVMLGTSGTVRLVSTGIPAKWYYDSAIYKSNVEAVDVLKNDFENVNLIDNLKKSITGSNFKVSKIANQISAMSLSDLNYAYNSIYNTSREVDDINILNKKNDLLYIDNLQSYYWLATAQKNDTDNIFCINVGMTTGFPIARMGIRPVIYLDENQTGIFESNVWKLN